MVAVFTGFALADVVIIKSIGLGMAVAVAHATARGSQLVGAGADRACTPLAVTRGPQSLTHAAVAKKLRYTRDAGTALATSSGGP